MTICVLRTLRAAALLSVTAFAGAGILPAGAQQVL